LNEISRLHGISKTTLSHVRALLSGMFREAALQDLFDLVCADKKSPGNPVRLVKIPTSAPKGQAGGKGAYGIEEVAQMLQILPEPANTAVSVAAYTGLRLGELKGLRWESYTPPADDNELGSLAVTQSIWRGHAGPPKSEASQSDIPVIPDLAKRLADWRSVCGNPLNGPLFPNGRGNPIDLDALYRRTMKDLLRNKGITWRGWHGFRRGLATRLHRRCPR
jgi:integrase